MHRDEIRTFRGNIETHLLRIFSFTRPRDRALPPTAVQPQFPPETPRIAFPPDSVVAVTSHHSTLDRAARIIVKTFARMMIPSVLLGALLNYLAADFAPVAWRDAFMSYWLLILLSLIACLVVLAIRKAIREGEKR
jgi:hypothetical protein